MKPLAGLADGRYVPAQPIPFGGWRKRWRCWFGKHTPGAESEGWFCKHCGKQLRP